MATSRRAVLQAALGGAAATISQLDFLSGLPKLSAAELRVDPKLVQIESGVAPLVELLETTSRGKLLEAVAARIRSGTSYREILAALMLAAVRNVAPRPSVGFKFHAVLVVNSAHLASLASRDQDRWLPIFWALDYFKAKQLEEERVSGWKLGPVDEAAVPTASRAREAFIQAMDRWDPVAADAAVAGVARHCGAHEVCELFYRYGARDYRSIGHKAIYVANSWRTLQCIGWHHAEPILRSLAFALLNHTDEPNPSRSDLMPDRAWRSNQELVTQIRPTWRDGQVSEAATVDLLQTLHGGTSEEAAEQAVEILNRGVAPQSIWDAVLVGAGELLMRQPGIIGLHALTTANALHHAYQSAADEQTRKMVMLQNCSFLPLFRESAIDRGNLKSTSVGELTPEETNSEQAMEEIFGDISQNRSRAASKVLHYLREGGSPTDFVDEARRMIFVKGRDAHDYKFSSAVLEDYHHVSPAWRDQFLALSVFNLQGSGGRDNSIVERTRSVLG